VVEQVRSPEAGTEVNMLTIRHVDKKWTRIIDVCYDKNEKPMEEHVTDKFKWTFDMIRGQNAIQIHEDGEVQETSYLLCGLPDRAESDSRHERGKDS
jgi:hypothetical protein